ncbi:MAG: hypothetical protein PHT60_10755 [Acidiphilium sp.]|nr:hypothetical protein [Acidiphilium sp.]MDD4936240.1 hypothetical protein [Acidiphilium sp.]
MQLEIGSRLTEIAYRLRYDAYYNGGFIPENFDNLFAGEYDLYGIGHTAIIFQSGTPAATVRIARHDPLGSENDRHELPAMKMFGSEIRSVVAALETKNRSSRAIEINRLARATNFAKT